MRELQGHKTRPTISAGGAVVTGEKSPGARSGHHQGETCSTRRMRNKQDKK